jgi:hypothetical protein
MGASLSVTIGIDTAKNTLHMIGLDEKGAIVLRRDLGLGLRGGLRMNMDDSQLIARFQRLTIELHSSWAEALAILPDTASSALGFACP